jgi:hypothetical protein
MSLCTLGAITRLPVLTCFADANGGYRAGPGNSTPPPQITAGPEGFTTHFGAPPASFQFRLHSYFGVTSRANLLATTSRISLRFFAASSMASREP